MSRLGDSFTIRLHDWLLDRRFDALRTRVVGGASGRVLEIGAGTGLNFAFYAPGTDVIAIEPARPLREKAVARSHDPSVHAHVEVVDARAEKLPFDAASFDAVVLTFTLCSIDPIDDALAEIQRVLRPGGGLHLVEHVLSPDARMARWQRRVQPLWTHAFGGCVLTREPATDLARAGFDASGLTQTELPMPQIVSAGMIGRAVKR